MSPFDIIKSIQEKTEFPLEEWNEKEYIPFVINKSMSFIKEYIPYVDAMNMYPDLPAKMQCLFYYHAIPRGKKYSKWLKDETVRDSSLIEMIAKEYGINIRLAEQYLKLLDDEKIEIIRKRNDCGGRTKS